MADIVDRCRAAAQDDRLSTGALYAEAADEIERLRLTTKEQDAMKCVIGAQLHWFVLHGDERSREFATTLRGALDRCATGSGEGPIPWPAQPE